MVSYLVRERTPARVVNRIGEFDSSRQSYKLEREVIPEEPELRWGALLTACFPCKLFFISKKDRDDPDRGGLGSLGDAIREMWGSRLVKVFDYIEEDPNDS